MAGKYDELADFIVENVGGKENVNSLTHCITRLRFKLKDESIANTDALKNKDGVVTVMQSGGQYQVVIGNHVPDVYAVIGERHGIGGGNASASADESQEKMSVGAYLLDIISGVFQPVLGVLCASGMLKGLLALLTFLGLTTDTSGLYILLYAAGDGIFYFFPLFLGATAARKFNINEFLGMAIGAAMCYPTVVALADGQPLYTLFGGTIVEQTVYTSFLSIPVILPGGGYTSSVIPIVLAVFVASYVNKFWNNIIPDVVKTFVVPLLTLIVVVPLTFLIVGPIAATLSSLIGSATEFIYNLSPIICGAFVGFFWQILVIFGLHWGMTPIMILNLTQNGYDAALQGFFGASFAQTAVVFAIFLRTKDKALKDLALPATISGIFGVTEPAIYGVTLPRIKYFIYSCIGAACGGLIMGMFQVKSYIMGGLGVFGFPSYISPEGDASGLTWAVVAVLVSMAVAFALTFVTYKDDEKVNEEELGDSEFEKNMEAAEAKDEAKAVATRLDKDSLAAPIKGKKIPLSEVKDEVFSTGLMGQGLAIVPEVGELYAPADGVLSTFFPTGHAIGMTLDSGPEILMHVGMDTVNLDGKHFYPQKKQGDHVKKGDLLLKFDVDEIKKAGYPIDTPILIVDPGQFTDVVPAEPGDVEVGDTVVTLL